MLAANGNKKHIMLSESFKDLCAVAPVPTQPISKLLVDGTQKSPSVRRSTAADLLQEKFNIRVSWQRSVSRRRAPPHSTT
jgi:hypothetical protein